MERVVIEVEPKVALAWRRLTPQRKIEITNKVGVRIGKEVLERPVLYFRGRETGANQVFGNKSVKI